MSDQKGFISNLTPIRGIAAILVVIFHFEIIAILFLPPETSMIFRKSYLMVDLFFVMSGFIISHVYLEKFEKSINSVAMAKYVIARIARIYPLHVITLAIVILQVMVWNSPLPIAGVNDPIAIPTHLLLMQSFGLHSIYTWNIPTWSISAEFISYLVFPFVIFMMGRRKMITIALTALFIVVAYWLLAYKFNQPNKIAGIHNIDITYNYGYLRGLAGFFTGVLVYQLFKNKKLFFLGTDAMVVLMAIALILMLHFGIMDLWLIPIFALFVLGVAYNQTGVKKFLDNKFMQFLGDISYSVYLIQLPLMYMVIYVLASFGIRYPGLFGFHLPYWEAAICCLLFLVVLIGISALSYKYVEKPLRKLINGPWFFPVGKFKTSETLLQMDGINSEGKESHKGKFPG